MLRDSQRYYEISEEELGVGSKIPISKLGDSGEVFYELANAMIEVIESNNKEGKDSVFICPVGPIGHYSIFTRLVNSKNISLKQCWFINMDEYLNDDMSYIDINSHMSFRGYMNKNVYDKIDAKLVMPLEQRLFPDPQNTQFIDDKIRELGGVDMCVGGIGINGHLAFNEADINLSVDEFASLPTRVLEISEATRTANSIGDLGGSYLAMPKYCVTIGMSQILASKRIRLGCFRDWHRGVIREACYGEISAVFPVTLLQRHSDALIMLNKTAALGIM